MHWTQTKAGRAKIAAATKRAWAKRRTRSGAERAVRRAIKTKGAPSPTRPKLAVRVYYRDPDGRVERGTHTVRTWGEFLDLMTEQYAGFVLDEVHISA